jgi:hypothetical protein
MGLQELGYTSPGGGGFGDNFSTGTSREETNLSSSWPSGSSIAIVGGY